MKRVLIIGAGGAGKTAVARGLAQRTGLPLVHLDTLFWRPGWNPTPAGEWHAVIEEAIRAEEWIMDGNYGGTLDLRLQACDTVVFLDRNPLLCIWRVLRRRARYVGRSRPDVAEGCPERLTWDFLIWIWSYPTRRRAGILSKLGALDEGKRVVILTSNRAIERFLEQAGAEAA